LLVPFGKNIHSENNEKGGDAHTEHPTETVRISGRKREKRTSETKAGNDEND
jgi:hypothetical protein